jgi:hypothetical protein
MAWYRARRSGLHRVRAASRRIRSGERHDLEARATATLLREERDEDAPPHDTVDLTGIAVVREPDADPRQR